MIWQLLTIMKHFFSHTKKNPHTIFFFVPLSEILKMNTDVLHKQKNSHMNSTIQSLISSFKKNNVTDDKKQGTSSYGHFITFLVHRQCQESFPSVGSTGLVIERFLFSQASFPHLDSSSIL